MSVYTVTYYEWSYSDCEIEASSPEEAAQIFWEKWGNDEEFVDEVLSLRTVNDSEIEVH